jgi:uncharacterized protein YjdB
VKFISESKDEAKIGVGLDSMVKVFKDVGDKIGDLFKNIRFVNLEDYQSPAQLQNLAVIPVYSSNIQNSFYI